MKVLALGGAGQEGSTTVRLLAGDDRIDQLIIADRNLSAAASLASEFSDGKVSALQVDVTDARGLASALEGVDVVANFVGPYYRFGRPILEAAIAARTNYVDICDDVDATLDCLELDAAARAAGVTAVIGLGASPGLANILGRRGTEILDRAEAIDIRWQVSATDVESLGASAAMYHFFHAIDGDVSQFIDGKMTLVPAYSGEETVEFKSIGSRQAFFTAHPEPVTLPRFLPGLQRVTCKGGILGLDEAVKALRALGLTGDDPIDVDGTAISPRRFAMALLETLPPPEPLPNPLSALKVCVSGQIGGTPSTIEFDVIKPTRMSPITGIPTAIGALMVGLGQVRSPGVGAPETAFEAAQFLAELGKYGVEILETRTLGYP